jgi:two-component system chemotaxis response regulator CheB
MDAAVRFRAIVVGASAGGVDALLRLLAALPRDFAPTLLVTLHRPPGQEPARASLATLLAGRCALPVADAWDRQPLEPGQVLLAPPDYHLLVDPGPVASLSVDPPVLFARPAIDPMFDSASRVFGAALLGLVLSGANADGAEGARALRRRGGRLWVQSPAEAPSPTMPQAALDRAGADEVLPLGEIGERFQTPCFRRAR